MANKNINGTIKSDNELLKLFRIVLLIVIIFGLFYGVTYFVTKNKNDIAANYESEKRIAAIQYDKILVGTMLNQKRNEFYVLLDKTDSDDIGLVNLYTSKYAEDSEALKIFTVDMNEPFNSDYYSDKSNITENITEFKINKITLLKIKDGSIVDSFEGRDSIVSEMKELIK